MTIFTCGICSSLKMVSLPEILLCKLEMVKQPMASILRQYKHALCGMLSMTQWSGKEILASKYSYKYIGYLRII